MGRPRPPHLTALDDQALEHLRAMGDEGAGTPGVFVVLWGPCHGYPHDRCSHLVSYSQVYASLLRLERAGLVHSEPDHTHERQTCRRWWATQTATASAWLETAWALPPAQEEER